MSGISENVNQPPPPKKQIIIHVSVYREPAGHSLAGERLFPPTDGEDGGIYSISVFTKPGWTLGFTEL